MHWDISINLIFNWILEISSYEIDWKKPSRTYSIKNERISYGLFFNSFCFLFLLKTQSLTHSVFLFQSLPIALSFGGFAQHRKLCERMTKINYILWKSQIVFEMTSDWFLFIVHKTYAYVTKTERTQHEKKRIYRILRRSCNVIHAVNIKGNTTQRINKTITGIEYAVHFKNFQSKPMGCSPCKVEENKIKQVNKYAIVREKKKKKKSNNNNNNTQTINRFNIITLELLNLKQYRCKWLIGCDWLQPYTYEERETEIERYTWCTRIKFPGRMFTIISTATTY